MRHLLLLPCILAAPVLAAERYVPSVDATGRLSTIVINDEDQKGSSVRSQDAGPKVVDSGPEASNMNAIPIRPAAQPANSPADGVYTPSEELEAKGYRPDGKKRFYYLPDGSLGKTPMETEDSVPMLVQSPDTGADEGPEGVRVSPNYMVIPRDQLSAVGIDDQCLSRKQLKKSRSVISRSAFRVYRPLSESDHSADMVFSLPPQERDSALLMVTHSDSMSSPAFYVPVAIFHDVRGCPVTAVWNYWTEQFPATELRFESLQAVLVVNPGIRYMSFHFPPPDLLRGVPFTEQREGSFTLESYE